MSGRAYGDARLVREVSIDGSRDTHTDPDYREHKQTYVNVMTLFKVSIVSIVITLLLMAWLVV